MFQSLQVVELSFEYKSFGRSALNCNIIFCYDTLHDSHATLEMKKQKLGVIAAFQESMVKVQMMTG